ncbi:MAG TPA: hypothetical protein VFH93_00005, partial [Thermoleophilia bacterium]|nr:hypothetical protein [Thermoleophilia bacterium]
MKTSSQLRLVRLSGLLLLLLSLLVVALAVSSAQAAGSGSNSSQQLTLAQILQRHGAGETTGTAAFTPAQAGTQGRGGVGPLAVAPADTQGRGGIDLAALTPAQAGTQDRGGVNLALLTPAQAGTQGRGGIGPLAPAYVAQPASPSSLSSTTWIAIGSALAVLVVGLTAWVLIRRRRSPELASASYCAQHPQDP